MYNIAIQHLYTLQCDGHGKSGHPLSPFKVIISLTVFLYITSPCSFMTESSYGLFPFTVPSSPHSPSPRQPLVGPLYSFISSPSLGSFPMPGWNQHWFSFPSRAPCLHAASHPLPRPQASTASVPSALHSCFYCTTWLPAPLHPWPLYPLLVVFIGGKYFHFKINVKEGSLLKYLKALHLYMTCQSCLGNVC